MVFFVLLKFAIRDKIKRVASERESGPGIGDIKRKLARGYQSVAAGLPLRGLVVRMTQGRISA